MHLTAMAFLEKGQKSGEEYFAGPQEPELIGAEPQTEGPEAPPDCQQHRQLLKPRLQGIRDGARRAGAGPGLL